MKKLQILFDKVQNKYMVGLLEREDKGMRYWQQFHSNWKYVRLADCESLEDIVELGESDYVSYSPNPMTGC